MNVRAVPGEPRVLRPEIAAEATAAVESTVAGSRAAVTDVLKARKSYVLRLGTGDLGLTVVAKRAPAETIRNELGILRLLEGAPVPAVRVYGMVLSAEEGMAWLVSEHVDGLPFDARSSIHRELLASWLAAMHSWSRSVGPLDLPDRGTVYHRRVVLEARETLEAAISAVGLERAIRTGLRGVAEAAREVSKDWDRHVADLERLPPTLVHGGVAGKNVVIRSLAGESQVLAYDWEQGGWGQPAADIAHADLRVYARLAAASLPGMSQSDIDRAGSLGRILWCLAGIPGERVNLTSTYPDRALGKMRYYEAEIRSALDELRADRVRPSSRSEGFLGSPRHPLLEGQNAAARVIRALAGRPLGETSRVAEVIGDLPNPNASRSPSYVVKLITTEEGRLDVFLKGGPRHQTTASGDPWGPGHEAEVYRRVLSAHEPFSWLYLDDFVESDWVWLMLRWLEGALPVGKAADPTVIVQAARWLGQFHRDVSNRNRLSDLAGFPTYDTRLVSDWLALCADNMAAAGITHGRLRVAEWARVLGPLLSAAPTLVHGDLYPSNVLFHDGVVVPIDWEWAGLGCGELDLAALTDGWPEATVQACITAYQDARWPVERDTGLHQRMSAGRAFLAARWLGGHRLDSRTWKVQYYLKALRAGLDDLGVDPDAGTVRRRGHSPS